MWVREKVFSLIQLTISCTLFQKMCSPCCPPSCCPEPCCPPCPEPNCCPTLCAPCCPTPCFPPCPTPTCAPPPCPCGPCPCPDPCCPEPCPSPCPPPCCPPCCSPCDPFQPCPCGPKCPPKVRSKIIITRVLDLKIYFRKAMQEPRTSWRKSYYELWVHQEKRTATGLSSFRMPWTSFVYYQAHSLLLPFEVHVPICKRTNGKTVIPFRKQFKMSAKMRLLRLMKFLT